MLESKIQTQIVKYLTKEGWFVLKIILSNKHGIMDLLILKEGRYIWVEVKQPGKEPTPLQRFRKKEIEAFGGEVICVHSLKEIINYDIN